MSEQIIGKGTWIDKVADTLIRREKKLGRSLEKIRVESGLGASGIPHIGSMGDAVRAYGISLSLENLGFKSELIAYSDDMDGLRKVPSGLPSWLKDYLGFPVSNIPDPFGDCHKSYGAHMSSSLLDGLDRSGIKYKFQSGADAYSSGRLVDQIDRLLENGIALGKKISEFVGQDKYNYTLPYFPVCRNCKKLYVARAISYDNKTKKVQYECQGSTIGNNHLPGCGYKGEADITKASGKLAWKVEFASRWQAFDIRFEAYGKDIMDSVKINDWVSDEILKFPHPLHVKYEMFLDKGGKKISKSAGNVLTPQMWLRYGTPSSLLLLLFKRITGTRHVGIEDIPILMDEYDLYESLYFGKIKDPNSAKVTKLKGIYEYINHLQPPKEMPQHIPYKLLVQQASLFPDNVAEMVYPRLMRYYDIKEKSEVLDQKIALASNWAIDNLSVDEDSQVDIELTLTERKCIELLVESISELKGRQPDPKELQSRIFEIARANNIEPKNFFILLYKLLINAERGPRLGNYIIDLGLDKTLGILEKHLRKNTQ